ncbi:BMC domain-containing protein [Vagococcus sp. BWB3-3]|uniref:BMC domain-containing protein n=1 Tax=Vagococcus allomyrinae TaxID=2794353 RepID=A0A940SS90_9ENTE|nr:BMC domain-containing protein [Vagococcus allomyrinae]MBP1041667.1 BMC domain-containing protein [Vagococcus allomyrinae]
MEYHGDEALGLIETIGMVPAIQAADTMLKAADVALVSYENVGSTLVTVMVKGDVAAVTSSVAAGVEAAKKIGKVTASNVMPRPIRPIGHIVMAHDIDSGGIVE